MDSCLRRHTSERVGGVECLVTVVVGRKVETSGTLHFTCGGPQRLGNLGVFHLYEPHRLRRDLSTCTDHKINGRELRSLRVDGPTSRPGTVTQGHTPTPTSTPGGTTGLPTLGAEETHTRGRRVVPSRSRHRDPNPRSGVVGPIRVNRPPTRRTTTVPTDTVLPRPDVLPTPGRTGEHRTLRPELYLCVLRATESKGKTLHSIISLVGVSLYLFTGVYCVH